LFSLGRLLESRVISGLRGPPRTVVILGTTPFSLIVHGWVRAVIII